MELVSCPEDEWVQRVAALGQPWEAHRLPVLPQGWLLLHRYVPEDAGPEAPGTVFPADGNPSGAVGAADSSFKGSPRWLGPCAWRAPGENLYNT